MPADAITFVTEAERLKVRKQAVEAFDEMMARKGRSVALTIADYIEAWDALHPPIAPPKMVPFEAWAMVGEDGRCCALDAADVDLWGRVYTGRRARVRVEEVSDE